MLRERLRARFSRVYLRHYRRLRLLDPEEPVARRLPALAARLAEEIEVEREALLVLICRGLEPARSQARAS